MDRDVVPAERVDQATIEVFEQAAAVFGERASRLVKDQIMIGLEERVAEVGTVFLVEESCELLGVEGLEWLVGRHEDDVQGSELSVGQDQGGLVAVLAIKPRDDALVKLIADSKTRCFGELNIVDRVRSGESGLAVWRLGLAYGSAPRRRRREGLGRGSRRCICRMARRRRGGGLGACRWGQGARNMRAAHATSGTRVQPPGRPLNRSRRMRRASPQPPGTLTARFHGRCSFADFV